MKRALKYIGGGLLLLILVLLVWGLIEPYDLDVERYSVGMPGLPPEWEGQQIAVIGDLQIGMWMDNETTVEQAVEEIVEEAPAATLILGDIINAGTGPVEEELSRAAALLRPLTEAGIPTYAVHGNHDYSLRTVGGQLREATAAREEEMLEAVGIEFLENEALPLPHARGGPPLYIVGIGSHYARKDFPAVALEEVPEEASRIVIMHHPDSFQEVPAMSAPLAVAGHTHGGQISIPRTPNWSLMSLYLGEEAHADGWIEESFGGRGNRLYVNRGLGLSILPLRILAQPELTYFVLQRSQGDGLQQPQEIGR